VKVGFSGHVTAEEAVGIFDGAALPRGMGIAEVGLRRELGVEVLMEGEFAAVVERCLSKQLSGEFMRRLLF
jgi:hypothetical protein